MSVELTDATRTREPVGFIGLGRMGLPMATNLVKAGYELVVWNRSISRTDELVDAGARRARSPAEVGRNTNVVLTMLTDLPAVEDVLGGDDGLLEGLRPGAVLVVHGTHSPVAVKELAERLRQREIEIVDAPVSGGDVGAAAGTLAIMVGGDVTAVDRVRPLFDAMGQTVRRVGAVGSGQLMKACNQIVVATTLTALGEALALARAGGLDINDTLDILEGGLAGSNALRAKREKLASRNYAPGGAAEAQYKDMGFVVEAARFFGVAAPVSVLVDQLYGMLCRSGRGELDHAAIGLLIDDLSRPANETPPR